jgi:hypothetical protein
VDRGTGHDLSPCLSARSGIFDGEWRITVERKILRFCAEVRKLRNPQIEL